MYAAGVLPCQQHNSSSTPVATDYCSQKKRVLEPPLLHTTLPCVRGGDQQARSWLLPSAHATTPPRSFAYHSALKRHIIIGHDWVCHT